MITQLGNDRNRSNYKRPRSRSSLFRYLFLHAHPASWTISRPSKRVRIPEAQHRLLNLILLLYKSDIGWCVKGGRSNLHGGCFVLMWVTFRLNVIFGKAPRCRCGHRGYCPMRMPSLSTEEGSIFTTTYKFRASDPELGAPIRRNPMDLGCWKLLKMIFLRRLSGFSVARSQYSVQVLFGKQVESRRISSLE